jgi:ribonuclease HI
LRESIGLGASELDVRTDSQLIQRQVTGVYKVRQPHLVPLMAEVRQLAGRLRTFRILHVPREENRIADALANRAMDQRASGREPVDGPR